MTKDSCKVNKKISTLAVAALFSLAAVTANAAVCNSGATLTSSLIISSGCDGASSSPLKISTGASLTVASGVTISNSGSNRNGDPISVLTNTTSSNITNNGTISTSNQFAININSNATVNNLTNFGTINGTQRRGIVNAGTGTINTLTNVGTIFGGSDKGITSDGVISTLNNLQGMGNAKGALGITRVLPLNYNVIINNPSTYGQLLYAEKRTGTMDFDIYGNAGTTLVNGIAASNVAARTYESVLQGFVGTLSGSTITGTDVLYSITNATGLYNGFNYSLVANPLVSGNWDLVFSTAVNPVPEADTSAMLLMGAGLMGFIARRRKNTQA